MIHLYSAAARQIVEPRDDLPRPAQPPTTPGGIPIRLRVEPLSTIAASGGFDDMRLHLEHARLSLLRGFDQLLCLEGLRGVEQLPHQIETVRKVLRHFRGRVLLADEVGLGKTIEACLLLREYLLRGLARRVLILVPTPLVSQWQEELSSKFDLHFTVPPRTSAADKAEFWAATDTVLVSQSFAKSRKRARLIAEAAWDLVIVDEAHRCKNRKSLNWQMINALKRRHMFLLTATPVQNNLVELYNLLTLLEPGHLKTEAEFKRQYVQRGNPRDPRNRERLRSLLGEVMIRNTRSLVQMDLPPRYAQTLQAQPGDAERQFYELLNRYLRERGPSAPQMGSAAAGSATTESFDVAAGDSAAVEPADAEAVDTEAVSAETVDTETIDTADAEVFEAQSPDSPNGDAPASAVLNRMQLRALLSAQGSHPAAVAQSLSAAAGGDLLAAELVRRGEQIDRSAKDDKLLDLLAQSRGHKTLVFVNLRRTLRHLQRLLGEAGVEFSTFSGEQSDRQKDEAVEALQSRVGVMLCTDAGGEGRNLQFADTLVNYDLPWNPMRIEQRVGRVHRIGQQHEVFVFNLCTAGSLEDRILKLLNEKIRMFELVVGEVGSILGNLDEGEEFESLVLNLWLRSRDEAELEHSFGALGDALLEAQTTYLEAKELDEALFGDDYE